MTMIFDNLTLTALIAVIAVAGGLYGVCKLRDCNRPLD